MLIFTLSHKIYLKLKISLTQIFTKKLEFQCNLLYLFNLKLISTLIVTLYMCKKFLKTKHSILFCLNFVEEELLLVSIPSLYSEYY